MIKPASKIKVIAVFFIVDSDFVNGVEVERNI